MEIPTITVFVSTPSTKEENDLVKRLIELKFAPLVDANHKRSFDWFKNNVAPVPHKLFSLERQNVYYYDVEDLNENMTFGPNLMIHWNHDYDGIDEEKWRWIREWLVYYLYTCYDYLDFMNDEIKFADKLLQRPVSQVIPLLDSIEEEKSVPNECYLFQSHYAKDRDTMLYEIRKPFTDLPYTSVTRNFSVRGNKPFFASLYICSSWGVSRDDLPFLSFIWKQLEMVGEFDIDSILKEATERCYPGEGRVPEPEPEVYRRELKEVLTTLQCQEEGIMCGHLCNDVPEAIRDRFKVKEEKKELNIILE
jgi:hypothetical protein